MKEPRAAMISPRLTIKAIALVMLVLHLFLPPVIHARGLVPAEPHRQHLSHPVCIIVDGGADRDAPENHHHATGICHPDIPFVITRFPAHDVEPAIAELATFYAGKLLTGHPRPLYIPPKDTV